MVGRQRGTPSSNEAAALFVGWVERSDTHHWHHRERWVPHGRTHPTALPFYEALGVPVQAILTDNGREFCGKPEQHPYELLLAMEGIEHRRTKIATPSTNGFVERMNRTLPDECFRVAGRQTWYITPAEIQRDLDAFLRYYNLERSHQGYRLRDRTPA